MLIAVCSVELKMQSNTGTANPECDTHLSGTTLQI